MIIHFIWIGSQIPMKYLHHVYSFYCLAQKYGHQVIIWTDELCNIYGTLFKSDIPCQGLKLKIKLVKDLIKQTQILMPQIVKLLPYLYREMVGRYKNLGAAADILRLFALFVKGGLYIDVDNRPANFVQDLKLFTIESCDTSSVTSTPFLTMTPANFMFHVASLKGQGMCNNDLLYSKSSRSPLVQAMILECLNRYQACEFTWSTKRESETQYIQESKCLAARVGDIMRGADVKTVVGNNAEKIVDVFATNEIKISSLDDGMITINHDVQDSRLLKLEEEMKRLNEKRKNGRLNQTLHLSGPLLVGEVLRNYCYSSTWNILDYALPLQGLKLSCDQNWFIDNDVKLRPCEI